MNLLKVSGISRREGRGFVLRPLSFTLEKQQKIVIAGATGSGKTTVLKIIAGLLQTESGEILFEGENVKGPDDRLIPGHPGIAYLSQHFELRNNYTVLEVLEYANSLPAKQAALLYEICRIGHLLVRKTDQLSGGERQRIALARLLGSSPRLLLLDEPFSNLDPIHKSNLKAVIRDIGERLGTTCILVSHDSLDTLPWAERILVLENGALVQTGSPEEIYYAPINEYVAGLFGTYQVISSEQAAIFSTASLTVKPGIFRPEHFRIGAQDKGGIQGTIHRVAFAGAFYEMDVQLPNFTIILRTTSPQFEVGNTVYLSIDPNTYKQ